MSPVEIEELVTWLRDHGLNPIRLSRTSSGEVEVIILLPK